MRERQLTLTQTFSPNHVITFIRPKSKQPNNHAMFSVPLKWNKFDLRDYLFHVYNVEVRGVRAFVNQQQPERRGGTGKWYRPQAEKMMVAELVKPFAWPDAPAKDARAEFDYDQHRKMKVYEKQKMGDHENLQKGKIALRTDTAIPVDRKGLRKQAEAMRAAPEEWESTGVKGGKWKEVETEDSFDFDDPEQMDVVNMIRKEDGGETPSSR